MARAPGTAEATGHFVSAASRGHAVSRSFAPDAERLAWRRILFSGVVGAVCVVIGSWGVGYVSSTPRSLVGRSLFLVPLRVPTAGVVLTAIILVIGALLLLRAWLRLGQMVERGDPPSSGLDGLSLRRVKQAVWAWSAPLLLAFPVFSQDVFSYAAQGRLMGAGKDPYRDWVSQMPGWLSEGSDVLWAQSSSPYGPLFLVVAQFVSWLSGRIPEVSILLFRVLALAGTALTLWALPRLANRFKQNPVWATWMVVANPLWLFSMVASAHNDSLMIGFLLAAFYFALSKRTALALLFAAASIAIKPIVVLGLPFFGLVLAGRNARWRQRFVAWAVTAVGVGLVLAVIGAATGLWFGWIRAMAEQGLAALPLAPWGLFGLAIAGIVRWLGGPADAVQSGIYTAGKVAALGLTVWLALRRPNGHPMLHFALALAAAVVLAPTIQPWYILWVLPLFVVWRTFYGAWEQFTIVLSAVTTISALVLLIAVPDWISPVMVRIVAGAVGGVGLLVLCLVDGATRPIFRDFHLVGLRTIADRSVMARAPLAWRIPGMRRHRVAPAKTPHIPQEKTAQ